MSKQIQGHSFWGKKWLSSLVALDVHNKVERAMQQGRNWKLIGLEIKDNMVKVHVALTPRKKYYLHFFLHRFDEESLTRLRTAIAADNMVMARLMKHELDPKILDITTSLGIKLFPEKWGDFKMFCSCPSWGMPCDHVAFALYMLSFNIDKDPFIIFSLHGLNLIELLKDSVGKEASDPLEQIPTTLELLKTLQVSENKTPEPETEGLEKRTEVSVDLTALSNSGSLLLNFLPHTPSFYPHGDFQDIYSAQLKHISLQSARMIRGKEAKSENVFPRDTVFQFAINSKLKPVTITGFQRLSSELLLNLLSIADDDLTDYHLSVKVMRQGLMTCLHLLLHGNVMPRLVRYARSEFFIVWEPLLIDNATRDVVEQFNTIIPPTLLTLRRGQQCTALHNRGVCLLSMILGTMINLFSRNNHSDSLFQFFFNEHRFSVQNDTKEGEAMAIIAQQVKAWLDHLTVGNHQFSPIIIVRRLQYDFTVSISFEIEEKIVPLKDIIAMEKYNDVRYAVLGEVTLLAPFVKGLEDHVANGAQRAIHYKSEEFGEFLTTILPVIRMLNIKTVVPDELKSLLRPAFTMSVSRKEGDSVTGFTLTDLLEFHWNVTIGDTTLSLSDFAKMVNKKKRYYSIDSAFVYVDESDLRKLKKLLSENDGVTHGEKLQALLSESYNNHSLLMTDEVRSLMLRFSEAPEIAVPNGLNGTLRPYQKRGYEWMYRNTKLGFGSIIADDMGLGKTIQVIALLLKLKEEYMAACKSESGTTTETVRKQFLVVVPTTLVSNWKSELERFAPELECHIYHGGNRSLEDYSGDILLTTYGLLRNDIDLLGEREWDVVVIDEAQNIKNATTAQSRAVRGLKAKCHIAMSGTPIENRMSEFWSIMDFANKGFLGSAERFRNDYALPIQQRGDRQCAARFRKVTAPFLLRRLKSDKNIISDLPDKIEKNMFIQLTDFQASLYRHTVDEAMTVIEAADMSSQKALFRRQGLVLQMILALKQICDHPSLFLKDGKDDSELSGKTEALLTLVENIVANRQKVLIFTQFSQMGKLLTDILHKQLGITPLFLHGENSLIERREMVEEFQSRDDRQVFILSIKAGGTGLNLTAASHVIHYDLWWNPAVEQQATDRAYRIGQHQNVIVYRFVTQGTFEEQIDKIIQAKKELADMTVATGENWIGQLSNEELEDIFKH